MCELRLDLLGPRLVSTCQLEQPTTVSSRQLEEDSVKEDNTAFSKERIERSNTAILNLFIHEIEALRSAHKQEMVAMKEMHQQDIAQIRKRLSLLEGTSTGSSAA